MDSDELVSILKQKFQGVDREVIRAVLEDNDNRLAAAEEALRSVATRQGGSGTGPSGRPVRHKVSAQISAGRRAYHACTVVLGSTQPCQHSDPACKRLLGDRIPARAYALKADHRLQVSFRWKHQLFRLPPRSHAQSGHHGL